MRVVGSCAAVSEGESIDASGNWSSHPKFGRQFVAESISTKPPSSDEAMRIYLSSDAVEGIGSHFADKIVKAFGSGVFDIIESDPDRLLEVEGIGKTRARKIKQSWDRQRETRDVMLHLHSYGIGPALANRIRRHYGKEAVEVLKTNPYRLAREIHGVGFKTADSLALGAGYEETDMRRIRAGIIHLVREASNEGHCGVPVTELTAKAAELMSVEGCLAEQAIYLEFKQQELIPADVSGQSCAFHPELYHAEQGIADRLRVLRRGTPPWRAIDCDKAVPWAERRAGITFGDSQSNAVRTSVSSKLTVITGGPGVGKTTIVNTILEILSPLKVDIKLCAPTGRAAKRMTEATRLPASTIHRLLAFDPQGGFRHGPDNRLECDLLIVDEASMIDVPLMNSLLQALPDQAALILVGDVDQLPSVGPGRVLADIIESQLVPVVRLAEVFRQAAASRIIRNAHLVNSGKLPEMWQEDGSDFYFVGADTADDALSKTLKLVCERIPDRFGFDPARDIQVLCPMIRGSLGVQGLNAALQPLLNPERDEKVERFGWDFALGDKVMQTRNNYDKYVFNGDIGFISGISRNDGHLNVSFGRREVELDFDELDGLLPAYAVTIHKSQGSEFPAVVIPVMTQHFIMLKRKLLYTGITRGKNLVVLVGQKRAIGMAVRGGEGRERVSLLRTLMQ